MKKMVALFVVFLIMLSSVFPVYAADGKVTYSGNAGKFIFKPGGGESLTDLFPNFKDVMPGDSLTQKITVKNNAGSKVKVKIYLRSLGADEDSAEFLAQLNLKIAVSEENEMAYMFDAAANETAQLIDWVCLGTLYAGGKVNLDVTLDVPAELSNTFQVQTGYLKWEFRVEECPVEPGDPEPPQTGDDSHFGLWYGLMGGSAIMIIILLLWRKKDKEDENNAV